MRATLSTNAEDTTDVWSGRVRHLAELGSTHHAFAASISYATRTIESRSDFGPGVRFFTSPSFSNKTYFADAILTYTFYPRTDVGVGLSLSRIDAEFGSDNSEALFANWFVTDRVGLRARYAEQSDVPAFGDSDVWEFGVTGRF